jgi:hypothetical protein
MVRREEEKWGPRVLRVSMDILTPPHDSWRDHEPEEERMDKETQKDTRQGCKRRRTMHYVTINQMILKTEDPKKQTSSRNRSPSASNTFTYCQSSCSNSPASNFHRSEIVVGSGIAVVVCVIEATAQCDIHMTWGNLTKPVPLPAVFETV